MSLVPGFENPAIDNLVQSSLENEDKYLRLEWIPYEEITNIKPTHIDNVHYAIYKRTLDKGDVEETMIMLSLLGNDEICTPIFVSEFARIYSLLTRKYNIDGNQFRRYST